MQASAGFALGLLLHSTAWADRYQLGGGFEGGAKLEASAVSVDNYFYQEAGAISANGYRIRPEVSLNRPGQTTQLSISSFAENSDFDLPGELDNYLDFGATGDFGWRPYRRHAFDFSGAFRRGHDPSGLQRTEQGPNFSAGDMDRWNQTSTYLLYRYGAPDSLASNSLRAGRTQRKYQTNRDDTVFLDYTVRELQYELAYEYSPRTALLFNAEQRATNYARSTLSSVGNRNGNELTLTGGLRWVATAKTSGEFRIGIRNYSVDERRQSPRQSLAYRATIRWNPSLSNAFKFGAGQSTTETFRSDTFFLDERKFDVNWERIWSSRLNTNVGIGYIHSEFVGSQREDDFISASVGFDYLLMRQLKVFGQYLSRNRDSSFRTLDYDAPESKLGLRWTL
ncbi:MAG: outer membrane beta-barrel protein [Pseudomonadota bacterium]